MVWGVAVPACPMPTRSIQPETVVVQAAAAQGSQILIPDPTLMLPGKGADLRVANCP